MSHNVFIVVYLGNIIQQMPLMMFIFLVKSTYKEEIDNATYTTHI